MEPEMYASETMTSPGNAELITAMQQRMLNMENALTRVIRHLESTSGIKDHARSSALGQSIGVKEDWEDSINTVMQDEIMRLRRLINQFEHELHTASKNHRIMGKPISLLEVFCSAKSPLTHQMQCLGHQAMRFGFSEGDLSTVSGREKLFVTVIRHQPHHVWVSPDCGPWSSWSRLNESRSVDSKEMYNQKRSQLLYQIALCIVLFRHQLLNNREFHWDQPARSLMLTHPGLAEVHSYTKACQFDMCRAGDLKRPLNGMMMKKGMVVLTTYQRLYQILHGQICNHQHNHQPIEGTTITKDGPISRTEYTAIYPRKFARTLAKTLGKIYAVPMRFPFLQVDPSTPRDDYALTGQIRVRKTSNFARSELISPEAQREHESKRRRLAGKQSAGLPLESFQQVMSDIAKIVPRVGKMEIDNANIIQLLQELFPDKHIVRVIACRGTDRTLGPPERMNSQEAPCRKCLMIHRASGDIKMEKSWEKWDQLSKRQLVRPSHPCRINVTMFARDMTTVRSNETATSSSVAPSFVPQAAVEPGASNVPDTAVDPEAGSRPEACRIFWESQHLSISRTATNTPKRNQYHPTKWKIP